MNQNSKERHKPKTLRRPKEQKCESEHIFDRSAKNVSVDLTPLQKAKLRELAARSDMKMSEYLRAVIKDALELEPRFEVEYRKIASATH